MERHEPAPATVPGGLTLPVQRDAAGVTLEASDGDHTFGDLYRHRTALFAALCRLRPDLSWRSRLHDDGQMFGGYFIAGMGLPNGRRLQQITYRCANDTWHWFDGVPVLERAPVWDGHSSDDVVDRLNAFWRLDTKD